MLLSLTHTLSSSTPFYDGLRAPHIETLFELAKGDVCNSSYFTTNNHCGTHVDGPNHFNPSGRKIAEFGPEELVFRQVREYRLSLQPSELIDAEHLSALDDSYSVCEALILHTGFGSLRANDPHSYVHANPGFSKRGAEQLMERLPRLKALLVDFVSISATQHEAEGAEAHRVFLGCQGYGERTILLAEDCCIPDPLPPIARLFLVPWMIEGLDSAPCTIWAEVNE